MNRHVYVLCSMFLAISAESINVGTALYSARDTKKTWTEPESIELQGRKIVEQLLPTRIPDGMAFIKYMKLIVDKSVIVDSDPRRKQIMVTVADAMGGYMYGVLLPKIKASYYEGSVSFDVAGRLYGLMRKIKFVLDTDGSGWINTLAEDKVLPAQSQTNIEDYDDYDVANAEFAESSCEELYLGRSVRGPGEVVVPIPVFDNDRQPGSLVLPFAIGKQLFSVDVPGATDNGRPPLLTRYYRLAVGCTSAAPDRFRRDVRRWLDAAVVPLLANRRRWYPVLAGASRVVRAAASAADPANRPKRKASNPLSEDDVNGPVCDDPDVLPNTNMFSLVLLVSFTCTWLSFGVLSVHKENTGKIKKLPTIN